MTTTDKQPDLEEAAQTPKLIDRRYQIDKLLNSGGMASVYRALDLRLERDVAVKIMHPHLAYDQRILSRFEQEARSAARLLHPNIVQVYDQGVWRGRAYLVMEFVNGPNLRQILEAQGCFPIGQAIDYLLQILSGLEAAHYCHLIHRDVKPENVLITPEQTVKVADFGLSHALHQATGNTTGSVMGTVAYLAPELITGQTSDEHCDIYAAGMMFYELLTGVPALLGQTAIQTAWAHVNQEFPDLTQSAPWLPEAVGQFLKRICAQNPEDRPAHAGIAKEQLQHLKSNLTQTELATICPHPSIPGDVLTPDYQQTMEDHPRMEVLSDDEPRPSELTQTIPLPASTVVTDLAEDNSDHSFEVPSDEEDTTVLVAQDGTAVVDLGAGLPLPAEEEEIANIRASADQDAQAAWGVWREDPETKQMLVTTAEEAMSSSAWDNRGVTAEVPLAQAADLALTDNRESANERNLAYVEIPEAETTTSKKKSKKYIWIAAFLTLILGCALGSGWWFFYGPGSRVQVPNLVGKTQAQATQSLKAIGLNAKFNEEFSDTVEKGLIIKVSPAKNAKLYPKSVVTITLSKGVQYVTVPQVTGVSIDDARKKLEESLLVAGGINYEYSEEVAKDQVISQSVTAGESVKHHSPVDLVVSKGRQPIQVPDLVGKQITEAKQNLEALGLKLEVTEVFHDTVPAGQVMKQDVKTGETRYRGDSIKLTVSKGPELFDVPNTVGMPLEAAKNKLLKLGFNVQATPRLPGYRVYRVYSQDPAGGKAKKGTTIKLVYI